VIGITTTVPVEIVFAAGLTPVDLNNLFITSDRPKELIAYSEAMGFSSNICAWIKGIFSIVINRGIKKVISVTGGDCSNTIALGELLARRGVQVIPFEYPYDRNRDRLWAEMDRLRKDLKTEWDSIIKTKSRLDRIRTKLKRLDQLSWQEGVVTGAENHLFLVNSSDFNGNPEQFEKDLDHFLFNTAKREPIKFQIRLGYLGVPPIFNGFYEFIESLGARIVYNEVQRQFSMPFDHKEIVDQYLEYTYPYGIGGRIKDIKLAVKQRRLDGLIHYTQTFCHRQIYDMMIREDVDLPVLTLEEDQPGHIDARTATRIETFIEMLNHQ